MIDLVPGSMNWGTSLRSKTLATWMDRHVVDVSQGDEAVNLLKSYSSEPNVTVYFWISFAFLTSNDNKRLDSREGFDKMKIREAIRHVDANSSLLSALACRDDKWQPLLSIINQWICR